MTAESIIPITDTGPRPDTGPSDPWPVAEPGSFEAEAGNFAYWMVQEALDRYPVAPAWMKSLLTGPEWRSHITGVVADVYGEEQKRHVEDLRIRYMGSPEPMRRKASVLHMRESFEAAMRAIGGAS